MTNDESSGFESAPTDFVRPFLVTAGRTKSSVEGLQFETMIQAGTESGDDLRFEGARVFELCQESKAIAEISAHLKIPIGTIKVLVGDLIESGHLDVHQTLDTSETEDVQLISRLIDGVRRL